jgi:hypothetical protein
VKVFKLTDANRFTYGLCLWKLGVPKTAPGSGPLCSAGWLHCYNDPLLAVLLNPVHAACCRPRLFEARAAGKKEPDAAGGLKLGVQELTLLREMSPPEFSPAQHVRFAILAARAVCRVPTFASWAKAWLSGSDRTERSAQRASSAMSLAATTEGDVDMLQLSYHAFGAAVQFARYQADAKNGSRHLAELQFKSALCAENVGLWAARRGRHVAFAVLARTALEVRDK